MKILVVDDTRIILSVVEAILTRDQHEVFTACDGREGYLAFVDHRPDMVITDIEMPWQDGLSMMQAIRRVTPRVVAIYMTGNPGPYQKRLDDEVRWYAAGILYKPFTRGELIRCVGEVIPQADPFDSAFMSLTPPESFGSVPERPAKYEVASLSSASFERESRYAKIDRVFGDGIRAGGRG